MSNGRSEKRIARAVTVEVCFQDETMLKERTLTENVSAHGARVLMQRLALRLSAYGRKRGSSTASVWPRVSLSSV
jgi:hypothetical protein